MILNYYMTEIKQNLDSYDETKKMLNIIRGIQRKSSYINIREQIQQGSPVMDDSITPQGHPQQNTGEEKKDFKVINNVEVVIQSTDPADTEISDEESGKISQLIDDFRSEVSEIVDFGKLIFYGESAKLDGVIGNIKLGFTLSTGDDEGLFLSNTSLLKMSDDVTQTIEKLKKFQYKFMSVINDLISARKQN